MHKIRVSAVKTLETGKFNAETAEYENPAKATIKWDKSVKLAEAAQYNNQDAVILTEMEYKALSEGQGSGMSEIMRERLKTALASVLSVLDEKEE